jgi:flavin reductase (DIM6/NTAB) family NADH-FMN oxidoreductase RutF
MGSPFTQIDPQLYAITARDGDREDAMIATWILELSLADDRGRLLVALTPDHLTTELILKSRRFVVNVLAEGQQGLIARLGLKSGHETNKLEGVDLPRTESGLALLPGTCGYAECEVLKKMEIADRVIIAAVIREQKHNPGKRPMTLGAAYRALPKQIVEACEEQRKHDGERDAYL